MAKTPKKKQRKPIHNLILIALMFVALDQYLVALYTQFVHKALSTSALPTSSVHAVDAAVVFLNGFGKESGLDADTERSLTEAYRLLKLKRINNIICVGGARPSSDFYGASIMRDILIKRGAPPEHVFDDRQSYDSYTNWHQALKIAAQHGWQSLVVISTPLHTLRLRFLVRHTKLDIFTEPAALPPLDSFSDYVHLWKLVHHEWLAWFAMALIPQDKYDSWLKWLRGRQTVPELHSN